MKIEKGRSERQVWEFGVSMIRAWDGTWSLYAGFGPFWLMVDFR